jgi:hypothetical protein
MPSPLVNRYAVYVALPGKGRVRRALAHYPSLMLAIESCFTAYERTGHVSYVIEDRRPVRALSLDRRLLLGLLFLRANDRSRYYDVLNRLDRSGDQKALESSLAQHIPL